jgi:endonuclease YncB( thermonuclease family)
VRFYGIDTPELKYAGLNKKTENLDIAEIKEKKRLRQAGIEAKDFLVSLIDKCPNRLVYLECKGKEKFGRLLAEVFPVVSISCFGRPVIGKESFTQKLIDAGHGVLYFGDARNTQLSSCVDSDQ